jgi:hypothetical protein
MIVYRLVAMNDTTLAASGNAESVENPQFAGSSPAMRTTFPKGFEGASESRTLSAQPVTAS